MAQDLSIEDPDAVCFITARTIASKLWFVNNRHLESRILSFLAKYQLSYGVTLYGFILMGNHYHLIAQFPRGNRAAFLRSFNSIVARLVGTMVPNFDGGKLWARRARVQVLPEETDIEHWTLYAALNPVTSGLATTFSEYPSYNSFADAIRGRIRNFKLVDWSDFNNRKRFNSSLRPRDCTREYTLTFSRLPGYERQSQSAYKRILREKAKNKAQEIVQQRVKEGKGFAGVRVLRAIEPGTKPQSTKSSSRDSKRPIVLTLCREIRQMCLDRYFRILGAFREASKRFRSGDLTISFPPGTYRPGQLVSA